VSCGVALLVRGRGGTVVARAAVFVYPMLGKFIFEAVRNARRALAAAEAFDIDTAIYGLDKSV
jgi:hypothetical protein